MRGRAGCALGRTAERLQPIVLLIKVTRETREETEMTDTFDACLAFTLREEGGYVDDPADPGGATNMGITLVTYRQWSENPNLGSAQVQDMTARTARAIYRSLY